MRIESGKSRLFALVVLLALACMALPVQADTTNCTVINAVPFTISAPGKYCLGANETFAGTAGQPSAIVVNADLVSVDCNGYSITDTTVDAALMTTGVYIKPDQDYAAVRNCTLNDFSRGVWSHTNVGTTVEGTSVVRSVSFGIIVTAREAMIRDNRIVDTTGCYPLYVSGPSLSVATVQGNLIRGAACPTASGIHVKGGRAVVAENRIEGLGVPGGRSYGIFVDAYGVTVPAFIERNHLYSMKSSSNTPVAKTTTTTKSRCLGNTVVGSWTANTGCL